MGRLQRDVRLPCLLFGVGDRFDGGLVRDDGFFEGLFPLLDLLLGGLDAGLGGGDVLLGNGLGVAAKSGMAIGLQIALHFRQQFAVGQRHSRASLLLPAAATACPSGRTATAVTGPPCSK